MNTRKNPVILRIAPDLHVDRIFWLQLWEALPPDTEIDKAGMEPATFMDDRNDMIQFRLISAMFDYVPLGVMPEEMVPHFKLEQGLKTPKLVSIQVGGLEPMWFVDWKKSKAQVPTPTIHRGYPGTGAVPRHLQASGPCICDMAYTGLKTHRKDCPCH